MGTDMPCSTVIAMQNPEFFLLSQKLPAVSHSHHIQDVGIQLCPGQGSRVLFPSFLGSGLCLAKPLHTPDAGVLRRLQALSPSN
jgi:hypothetical protein